MVFRCNFSTIVTLPVTVFVGSEVVTFASSCSPRSCFSLHRKNLSSANKNWENHGFSQENHGFPVFFSLESATFALRATSQHCGSSSS